MSMSERSGSPFAFEIHVVESDADLGDTSCTLYTAANCGHFTVHRLIFQMTARRLVILPVLFRNLLHLLGRRSGTPFSVVLCVYQTAGVRLTLRLGFAAYVHSDVGVSGGVEEFGHGFKDQFAVVLGRQWLRADQKLSERESKHRIEQLFRRVVCMNHIRHNAPRPDEPPAYRFTLDELDELVWRWA
jgi:hypothetical protein